MKILLLSFLSMVSISCAHKAVRDFQLPDGSMATEVYCAGRRVTFASCVKLVNKHCKQRPYEILSIEKSTRQVDGSYSYCIPSEEETGMYLGTRQKKQQKQHRYGETNTYESESEGLMWNKRKSAECSSGSDSYTEYNITLIIRCK